LARSPLDITLPIGCLKEAHSTCLPRVAGQPIDLPLPAIEPNARHPLQRLHNGHRFRESVFLTSAGYVEMGKLMALSLLTTLAAAVIFQPALMATQQQKRLA
jgi:hypothetical protein